MYNQKLRFAKLFAVLLSVFVVFLAMRVFNYNNTYIEMEVFSEKQVTLQAFYDLGLGFNEVDSEKITITKVGDWGRVKFHLPEGMIKSLRLDPSVDSTPTKIRKIVFHNGIYDSVKRNSTHLSIPVDTIKSLNEIDGIYFSDGVVEIFPLSGSMDSQLLVDYFPRSVGFAKGLYLIAAVGLVAIAYFVATCASAVFSGLMNARRLRYVLLYKEFFLLLLWVIVFFCSVFGDFFTNSVQIAFRILCGFISCELFVIFCTILGFVISGRPRWRWFYHYAMVGFSVFILVCWFFIKLAMPVSYALIFLLSLAFVGSIIRLRKESSWNFVDNNIVSRYGKTVTLKALYFLVAALLFRVYENNDLLPLSTYFNLDPINYIIYAKYLNSHSGTMLLNGFDFIRSPLLFYEGTPGVFYIIAAVSAMYGGNTVSAAMPVLFYTAATISAGAYNMCKTILKLPGFYSLVVSMLMIVSPLLRYVITNYFLSQLMAASVMLFLLLHMYLLVRTRAEKIWPVFSGLLPYYFVLYYFYPIVCIISLFIAAGWAGINYLLGTVSGKTLATYVYSGLLIITALLVVDIRRAADVYHLLTSFSSQSGLQWWSFSLVPLSTLFGFPDVMLGMPKGVGGHSGAVVTPWRDILVFSILSGSVALTVFGFVPLTRERKIRLSYFLVSVMSFGLYYLFYLVNGVSYQQWKFASYLPGVLFFIIIGLLLGYFSREKCTSMFSAVLCKLFSVLCGAAIILFVVTNILVYKYLDKKLDVFPRYFEMYSELSKVAAKKIYVYSKNFVSSNFAVYYINNKELHLLGSSFYSIVFSKEKKDWVVGDVESLNVSDVTDDAPLFVDMPCSEFYGLRVSSYAPLGCLILEPFDLNFGQEYRFKDGGFFSNATDLVRDPKGELWAASDNPRLVVAVNNSVLKNSPKGFVNVKLSFDKAWKKSISVVVGSKSYRIAFHRNGWISVPYSAEDFSNYDELFDRIESKRIVLGFKFDKTDGDVFRHKYRFDSIKLTTKPLQLGG